MIASIAMISHVSPQSMLLTVEPVGSVDGEVSKMKDGKLLNKKKLEFISWTLNIGEYRLWPIIYGLLNPIFTLFQSKEFQISQRRNR